MCWLASVCSAVAVKEVVNKCAFGFDHVIPEFSDYFLTISLEFWIPDSSTYQFILPIQKVQLLILRSTTRRAATVLATVCKRVLLQYMIHGCVWWWEANWSTVSLHDATVQQRHQQSNTIVVYWEDNEQTQGECTKREATKQPNHNRFINLTSPPWSLSAPSPLLALWLRHRLLPLPKR